MSALSKPVQAFGTAEQIPAIEGAEAPRENKTLEYLEMAYDVLRGGVNLYKAIKGEPRFRMPEDLVEKPRMADETFVRATAPAYFDPSQAARKAADAFRSPEKTSTPSAPRPSENAVRIPVTPYQVGDTVGGDVEEVKNGIISKESIRGLLDQGYKLPTKAELKAQGFGVFEDGLGRVTGYVKPDGTTVQFELD